MKTKLLNLMVICLLIGVNLKLVATQEEEEPAQTEEPPAEEPPSGDGDGGGSGTGSGSEGGGDLACQFGEAAMLTFCSWKTSNMTNTSNLQFELTKGSNWNWIGGPMQDGDENKEGGYAILETSKIPINGSYKGSGIAILESPSQPPTAAEGSCLTFKYAFDGLSPDKLEVFVHIPHPHVGNESSMEQRNNTDLLLWSTQDTTEGMWRTAEVVFSAKQAYQLHFVGISKNATKLLTKYRGYIAIDAIALRPASSCPGHCRFDAGFCDWTNEETGDDFDWSLGRGSSNPLTGPVGDRWSDLSGESGGGYAFINSDAPRKRGDKAQLSSKEFAATKPDAPLCMTFWAHLQGTGIGFLRVLNRNVESNEQTTIWQINGDLGNRWIQGKVTISSSVPFKIIFEAEVGRMNLGDIAIDDVSFSEGACPGSPEHAVTISSSGDCSFELGDCGWMNMIKQGGPSSEKWDIKGALESTIFIGDHTASNVSGKVMTTATGRGGSGRPGSISVATLSSPLYQGSAKEKCLSFWYFVNGTGDNVPTLSVKVGSKEEGQSKQTLKTLWMLSNHVSPMWKYGQASVLSEKPFQIYFETTSGSGVVAIDDVAVFDGNCKVMPECAVVTPGECSFNVDMCGWNTTTPGGRPSFQLATTSRRTTKLTGKDFSPETGYVYFDFYSRTTDLAKIFLTLQTTVIQEKPCLRFWYAAFGPSFQDTTELKLLLESVGEDGSSVENSGNVLWNTTALQINTTIPEWKIGQITLKPDESHPSVSIVFEGASRNGGFAIDDISFKAGECKTIPEATPQEAETASEAASEE